ncbi:MAG: UxaA family hydrolase [Desulfobacteraceae bacterium]|nr:UxaA family hydrolase [Desulfobacteraceae bacterium]
MSERSFLGYLRRNSKVGVRSHVVVIPSVVCVSSIAEGIARDFSNVITLLH